MADTVVCVDTKPDAGDDSCLHLHRRDSGETCHILNWCTETCFIATEKDVRAAIDKYNRVYAKYIEAATRARHKHTLTAFDSRW